jgi:hypothetical protein
MRVVIGTAGRAASGVRAYDQDERRAARANSFSSVVSRAPLVLVPTGPVLAALNDSRVNQRVDAGLARASTSPRLSESRAWGTHRAGLGRVPAPVQPGLARPGGRDPAHARRRRGLSRGFSALSLTGECSLKDIPLLGLSIWTHADAIKAT